MIRKSLKLSVLLAMALVIFPQTTFAGTDSCTECNVLMNKACLAEKYLPFNQFDSNQRSIKEWSASKGNFFAKDNIIGVRFRLDEQSIETLELGGFGLEIEVVEKEGNELEFDYWDSNLPSDARIIADTKAFDSGNDTVNALLVRNPENLEAGKDYYAWFHFKDNIPSSGIEIQPNLVIDIDSDCPNAKPICYDVADTEVCEYFEMETDSYWKFRAYPDGKEGVCWDGKRYEDSNICNPTLQKINGRWCISKDTNPPDSEDTQSGDDYNNFPGSVTVSNPDTSSKKPNLLVNDWGFKNDKTKYYDDENITLEAKVKNSGKSVDNKITEIKLKYYRFKGEKENDDTKEMGSDNMKGENLASGHTKSEDIKFGAPDGDNKYQFYTKIDTDNAVSESNENDNQSGNIACRVHKRPDIKVSELVLNDGRTQFDIYEVPEAVATFTNSGGEPFVDIPVKWYLDGVHFADDNMRHWNIEHGDEKHEDVNLTQILSVGMHTLEVCASFDEDKNGDDNCKEISFEVIDSPIVVNPVDDPDDPEPPTPPEPSEPTYSLDAPLACLGVENNQPVEIKDVFAAGDNVWGYVNFQSLCCQTVDFRWDIYCGQDKLTEKTESWDNPNGCLSNAPLDTLLIENITAGQYHAELFASFNGGDFLKLTELVFEGEEAESLLPDEPVPDDAVPDEPTSDEEDEPENSSQGGSGGGCFIEIIF